MFIWRHPERHAKNPRILLIAALLFAMSLIAVHLQAQSASAKESALRAVGIQTVKAIAHGNPSYLVSIVDPQGILIGHDEPKLSAELFRNKIKERTGAYCELFESGCKTSHNPAYTLGYVFNTAGDPLNADLKFNINGNKATLDYSEAGGDGIATFSYRFVGGRWYLYSIYFV